MPSAPTPRMHGVSHYHGGPDPFMLEWEDVEGAASPSFPDTVAELAAVSTGRLLGYWRLGEGAAPFADTSGHSSGPSDLDKVTTGVAMSDDVTGALPAADDDGAVQFNVSTGAAGDYLEGTDPIPRRFNEVGSAAAWVKPGTSASSFIGNIVGRWVSTGGWRLGVEWPSRAPLFQRQASGGSPNGYAQGGVLTADEWAFVVGTYDSTDGFKLYVNGALVDSDTTTFAGLSTSNTGPAIGAGETGTVADTFYGAVDEVTVWGDALTADEILDLYTAGAG